MTVRYFDWQRKRKMTRESVIENGLVKMVEKVSGRCWKWISNSRRGLPDRIVLLPVPEEHQEIVNRYVKFVETKALGKKPTKQQEYVHGIFRGLGYAVHIVDNPEDAKKVIAGES